MIARIETDAELRTRLERDLRRARVKVEHLERALDEKRANRDRLVVELRRLPDPPSARAVAELAGISNPWVLKLEKEPG